MLTGVKGLLSSKSVLGGLLAMLPELIDGVNNLAGSGALPPKVASALHVVGGALAVFGRIVASKRIEGIF